MRIEHKAVIQTEPSLAAWEPFFKHFTTPPSLEEKQEMMNNLMQHLSHQIYQHMQRMINVYKKMRE